MSFFRAFVVSCATILSVAGAASQTVDITGVRLGMTVPEAVAKLPQGFQVFEEPERLPPTMKVTFALRGHEAYSFETVNGKIAYIAHRTDLAFGSEVDHMTYVNQALQKYGPPSFENDTHYSFKWQWNATGQRIPFTGCDAQIDNGFGISQFTKAAYSEHGAQVILGSKLMYDNFPTHDTPGCHTILTLEVGKHDARMAPNSISDIQVRLWDPWVIISELLRLNAEQKAKEDAAHKGVVKRTLPPM